MVTVWSLEVLIKSQSLPGGYYYVGLSVGDESLGHYSEVGCFSEEEGLLIDALLLWEMIILGPYKLERHLMEVPL